MQRTYSFSFFNTFFILPSSFLAIRTIALFLFILWHRLLNASANEGSCFTAVHADSIRFFRNGLFALGVMGPTLSFFPVEFVVGIKPTNEQSWSRFPKRFMSSISDNSVAAVTKPGIPVSSF